VEEVPVESKYQRGRATIGMIFEIGSNRVGVRKRVES
jgi:hypothetical protein